MTGDSLQAPDPLSVMRSRRFLVLLVFAAVVGVVASFAAWCFLELVHQTEDVIYTDLPDALGFDTTPIWWSLPVLAIAGLVVAFAIVRLPGTGGHVPAHGLNPSPTQPIELPGVILAAVAGIGLGAVVGPEAPLIALGGGLGFFAIRRLRADAPLETQAIVAACGTFAAISFLFGSPLIAAVLLIEATGLGGPRRSIILIPGLLAAGIGTLVSLGLGSWTGVDTADISLTFPDLPDFPRPDLVDFLWTVPLAAVIAVGTVVIFRIARAAEPVASGRPFVIVPAAGLIVAGLAIAFSEIADKGVNHVLFSGESGLTPLVNHADDWSLGALALLIGCKGIAYALSLASFRGGPAFPAIFLGAAAALMAAQLPGFETTPAVAVGIGAGVAAALRLPLSAIVLATLLTGQSGFGAAPLIIVGVVVAYLVANQLDPESDPSAREDPAAASGAGPPQPATPV